MVVVSAISDDEMPGEEGMASFEPSHPIWRDITPVQQDDGPDPLCPILYDPACAYVLLMQMHRRWTCSVG